MLGENKVWDSKIMDLSSPEWHEFVIETLVSPFWQSGYSGLFLDTMDSFKLLTANPAAEKRQIEGRITLLNLINKRYLRANSSCAFCVVIPASFSTGMPRSFAINAAISAKFAGSLRSPC